MSPDIKKNKISAKSRYRPEIDGLRAFAVVAVILNHLNKNILPGGYLGVDIFFVISGFVITSSLYHGIQGIQKIGIDSTTSFVSVAIANTDGGGGTGLSTFISLDAPASSDKFKVNDVIQINNE